MVNLLDVVGHVEVVGCQDVECCWRSYLLVFCHGSLEALPLETWLAEAGVFLPLGFLFSRTGLQNLARFL